MSKVLSFLKKNYKNYLLNVLGSMILAFATAIFLTNLSIVSGGVSGIALIIQSFFPDAQIVDIIVYIFNGLLWALSFLLVSKNFAIKTFISSLCYPLFLTLFLRVPYFVHLAIEVTGTLNGNSAEVGNTLLCATFGGVFSGLGIGLTLLGGGSTGGTDVIMVFIVKKTNIKESYVNFVLDASVIIFSFILIKDNTISSLCGIICAFLSAVIIELICSGKQTNYIVDIISDKYEEINNYIQNNLDRGTTFISVKGGYSLQDKVMLRVVIDKYQVDRVKDAIGQIDPHAFVTYSKTEAVIGEGFKKYRLKEKNERAK